METFFWHDYETFGRSPAWYRASQFAGVRTDFSLNIIEEPINIHCQPALDTLPDPEACLITGITPQLCEEKGVSEKEFAETVFRTLSKPGTCGAGYNNIRFDDVFTRNIFYRNFIPVYEREWKHGNSRWDLINAMRMARALRPEGISWPDHEDGKPSFKLEDLAKANHLLHESAHDALSDVLATIALAKLLKSAQPKLFQYTLGLRKKQEVARYVDPVKRKPFFHVSSRLKPEHLYSAIMMPLAPLPGQPGTIICIDLMQDPAFLLEASVEEIRERVFTRQADLPDDVERVSIKQVATNRIPMVADIVLVDDEVAERLQIDKSRCEKHWRQVLQQAEMLSKKLVSVMKYDADETGRDVDERLYDGFFTDKDAAWMEKIRRAEKPVLETLSPDFLDPRLETLFLRYKARNFPELLGEEEATEWRAYKNTRLFSKQSAEIMTVAEYESKIAELLVTFDANPEKVAILRALLSWKEKVITE